MGVRELVVTEYVCDVCKKPIPQGSGKLGVLEARATGARGRGERRSLAFHDRCYQDLVSLATKPAAARPRSSGAKTATAGASSRGRRGSRRSKAPAAATA